MKDNKYIKGKRKDEIIQALFKGILKLSTNDEEAYNFLTDCCDLTDNEIDYLSGNFDDRLYEFIDEDDEDY